MNAAWCLGLGCLCSGAIAAANEPPTGGRELVRDRHFLRGFEVYDPAPGQKVVEGKLQWEGCLGEPVWGLAQWHSRYSLGGAEAQHPAPGVVRFANEAKAVTVSRPGTDQADLTLALDSRPEYPEGPRKQGQNWPHLLAAQRIERSPALADLQALQFHAQVRLLRSERFEMEGYSRNLHAAQFITTLTVQNLNRRSPGFGDFIWLNLVQYDDRRPIPKTFIAPDVALKKLIYSPPGETLSSSSAHTGEWVTYDLDILPHILDGLRAAWERHFLSASQDLSNYRLGGLSIGWEVPGTFDVAVQVRNLSLRAIGG